MEDAYRGYEKNPFRNHLGASVIGYECARQIWYGFRWFTKPKFPGRVLRLFNRGHLEEARFIACLLTIGVQVYQQDANGHQFRIKAHGGHYGGSGDGVAIGIPDLPPGLPCLTEWKTHNDKSFQKVKKEGVRAAKFEHYVQMNTYCRKMGLTVALYGAVNKNDDELHLEIVYLDTDTADRFTDRAGQIIFTPSPPKRINESPGWYACKYCDHHAVCHKHATPARNCRTCTYSAPLSTGGWACTSPVVVATAEAQGRSGPIILDEDAQLAACAQYEAF